MTEEGGANAQQGGHSSSCRSEGGPRGRTAQSRRQTQPWVGNPLLGTLALPEHEHCSSKAWVSYALISLRLKAVL